MIVKYFIQFIGIMLMIVGEVFIILYFNLFTFGYTIKEYLLFIISRWECYLFVIGLIIEIVMMGKGQIK